VAAMELYSAGNGGICGRERERWLSLEVAAMKAREGVREVRQTWWCAQLSLRACKAVGCRAALPAAAMAAALALTSTERRRVERGGPGRVRRSKREGVESSVSALEGTG
jgi:hypothetical protein